MMATRRASWDSGAGDSKEIAVHVHQSTTPTLDKHMDGYFGRGRRKRVCVDRSEDKRARDGEKILLPTGSENSKREFTQLQMRFAGYDDSDPATW